jgi:hypothetical protein
MAVVAGAAVPGPAIGSLSEPWASQPVSLATDGASHGCEVRGDVAEALTAAATCGREVEIARTRTETRREWAQPNGTVRAEIYVGPEWVESDAGTWNRVDLTLEKLPDGSVAPRVHARGLRLSGGAVGGTRELAAVGAGAEQVSIGWNGRLPEPVLNGTTATYPEVRPGVDLVVEALNTGFEYFLIVKNPQAGRELGTVSMPWQSGALEPFRKPDGGIALRAADGSVRAIVPRAEMWDATVSPASGEPARRVAIDANVALARLVVLVPTCRVAGLAGQLRQLECALVEPTDLAGTGGYLHADVGVRRMRPGRLGLHRRAARFPAARRLRRVHDGEYWAEGHRREPLGLVEAFQVRQRLVPPSAGDPELHAQRGPEHAHGGETDW